MGWEAVADWSELRTRLSMMGLVWDSEDDALNEVIWRAYDLGRLDGHEEGYQLGLDVNY